MSYLKIQALAAEYEAKFLSELKQSIDKAEDKEYAKNLGTIISMFNSVLPNTFYEGVMNIYEFHFRLGLPFEEMMQSIKSEIEKKHQNIENLRERTKLYRKESYYLKDMRFPPNFLPSREIFLNEKGEIIYENRYSYEIQEELINLLDRLDEHFFQRAELVTGQKIERIDYIKSQTVYGSFEDDIKEENILSYIAKQIAHEKINSELETEPMECPVFGDISQDKAPVEWLGTERELLDLLFNLHKKCWIEKLDKALFAKMFYIKDKPPVQLIKEEEYTEFSAIKVRSNRTRENNAKEEGKVYWLGTQKNLAEVFVELFIKGWISSKKPELIQNWFSSSKSIGQVLQSSNEWDKGFYLNLYTERYKQHFDLIKFRK